MIELKPYSPSRVWSNRSRAWIDFNNVTGIKIVKDPTPDPYDDDFIFDWTLEFTLDGEYEIQLGYYCDESQARQEALIYAKNCWERR